MSSEAIAIIHRYMTTHRRLTGELPTPNDLAIIFEKPVHLMMEVWFTYKKTTGDNEG